VSLALALLLGAGLAGRGACAGSEADLKSAASALDEGRAADGERVAALVLAVNPDCPDALVLQGRILDRQGRPREARAAFEKAVRLAPANAEARYQLGLWLYRHQLHAEAVPHFEKVIALRPRDARAHAHLAEAFAAERERADLAYRAALRVNEGSFRDGFLDYYYGRFLLKEDRLDESRSYLDRAVALHPDERAVRYERGKLSLARKDYTAARQDAEAALALSDPAGLVLDLQVYYLLATVYARLGETELARKYAELSRSTEAR